MKWDGNDLYGGWDDGLAQPPRNTDLIPLALLGVAVCASVAVVTFVVALRLAHALRPGTVIAGD